MLENSGIVRACEDYARSVRYQKGTLVDLARAAGVSERRVRRAFRDQVGVPPTTYLRTRALQAAQAELLAGESVSRAATDFGFAHLSRFAAEYRKLFGELPKETRSRVERIADPPAARWRGLAVLAVLRRTPIASNGLRIHQVVTTVAAVHHMLPRSG